MNSKKIVKLIFLLLSCVLVGVLVACTYFLFEYAVHHSITFIWTTKFNSDTKRLLVIPLCVTITLLFFGAQHWLDPHGEKHEAEGLGGGTVNATVKNFLIVIGLGFLSLVAGASLGPEAVLVPACMIIGTFFGIKFFKKDEPFVKAMAAAAIMALMAAFFHSFIIGMLSIFLVKKQAQTKISPLLVAIAIVASGSSVLTLKLIDPSNQYFNFPPFSLKVALIDIAVAAILVVVGYGITFALKYAHMAFDKFRKIDRLNKWWLMALAASAVLSGLYLVGGPLVQFTGNESIAPMLAQASTLGIVGLVWIVVVKIIAISWSKAMGYRGGLVFPMIFVASTLSAILLIVFKDANFGVGLIAAMVGILAAERKAKILF